MNTTNEEELYEILYGAPVGVEIRTTQKIAKKWLFENKSMLIGGHVYYFHIRNLGLGVYGITKVVSHTVNAQTKLIK